MDFGRVQVDNSPVEKQPRQIWKRCSIQLNDLLPHRGLLNLDQPHVVAEIAHADFASAPPTSRQQLYLTSTTRASKVSSQPPASLIPLTELPTNTCFYFLTHTTQRHRQSATQYDAPQSSSRRSPSSSGRPSPDIDRVYLVPEAATRTTD